MAYFNFSGSYELWRSPREPRIFFQINDYGMDENPSEKDFRPLNA